MRTLTTWTWHSVSPNGTAVRIQSDACAADASLHTLTFDDANSSFLSNDGLCPSAGNPYDVTNHDGTGVGEVDIYSTTAVDGASTLNALSFFNGGPSGGAWRLFTMDDTTNNGGSISGWSITLDFTPTPVTTPPDHDAPGASSQESRQEEGLHQGEGQEEGLQEEEEEVREE